MADNIAQDPIAQDYKDIPADANFTVVVIGSGYGGSIVASRLARAAAKDGKKPSVCLLERGLERRPGEYPNTLAGIQAQSQIRTDKYPDTLLGQATAMFDLRVNEDVSALVGCGLGGTSLINANVSLEVDPDIFQRQALRWPRVFLSNPTLLEKYYQRAREGLGANPYPAPDDKDKPGYKPLNKFAALQKAARALGTDAKRPDINVSFRDGPNYFGFEQKKCNLCGDCCSGCNFGAKNTTLMNYLPDAAGHGAQIFCNTSVKHIAKDADHWVVHVAVTDVQQVAVDKVIRADVIVVAAGTLGSTEILLRSRENGLTVSKQLGRHFSGNGDVLAFGYNSYWRDNHEIADPKLRESGQQRFESIYAIGMGDNLLSEDQMPGPCITGVIDLRDAAKPYAERMIIEEGVAPGAFSSMMPAAFLFAAAQEANFMRYGTEQAQLRLQDAEQLADAVQKNSTTLSQFSYAGPVSRTQNYLVMSLDDSDGVLDLDANKQNIRIRWPGAGSSAAIKHDNKVLERANDAIQGQFIANPLWNDAFGNKLITVHPLGGCRMADDCHSGVVNDRCQVFDCADDNSIHDGLYVCDGAVIPGAIGVNPLLTISAIAERTSELIAEKYQWTIDYSVTDVAPASVSVANPATTNKTHQQLPIIPIPDKLIEDGLSLTALAGTAGLASFISSQRKSNALPSEKESAMWSLQAKVWSEILNHYQEEYKSSFSFTEQMQGFIDFSQYSGNPSPDDTITDLHERAYLIGQGNGTAIQLRMTIAFDDIKTAVNAERGAGKISGGSVAFTGMETTDLSIRAGTFTLLPVDPNAVETWLMVYEMECTSLLQEDKTFTVIGTKTLCAKAGSHWWTDLTQMNIAIYDGRHSAAGISASGAKHWALGRVKLDLQDFLQQVNSFSATLSASSETGSLINIMESIYLPKLKKAGLITDEDVATLKEYLETFENAVGAYYLLKLAAALSEKVFRAYGGLLANLKNFPKDDLKNYQPRKTGEPTDRYVIKTEDDFTIQLTRYNCNKGGLPVILAPGMGVNASSFATETVACNLVEYLTYGREGFMEIEPPLRDVWLFDYRASADSGSSTKPFTIDDIARYDWPAAIKKVLEVSGAGQVQIVAHCVGSLSLLMSLLCGAIKKDDLCSIISSQLTLHPLTNWLNNAKADLDVVSELADMELVKLRGNVVDMNSGTSIYDRMFDVATYQIPVPPGETCNSPTCHRIFSSYGPSYLHEQLNHATHINMGRWFGPIHLLPFKQMAHIVRNGFVVDAMGNNTYLTVNTINVGANGNQIANLDLPITFMAGALNVEFLPQTSQRTYDWLCAHNPVSQQKYHRHVFKHYGHMDCFIGKNAYREVFPQLNTWLNQYHP